jgi:hypothetical protein
MSVSGPITRIAGGNVQMFSKAVVDAATTVSVSLGYSQI